MLARRQYKEAKEVLERQVIIHPDAVRLLKLSQAYDQLGDLDDAIKSARHAVGLDKDNPQAHFMLARYLEYDREDLAALTEYEMVLDLKSADSLRLKTFGPYLRLLVKQGKGNVKKADKLSKKWVHDYAKDADCHFNRAWTLSQLNDPKAKIEAIDEYEDCLDLLPRGQSARKSSTRYNLALLLIQTGQKSEAAKQLNAFIDEAPKDADADNARQLIKQLE